MQTWYFLWFIFVTLLPFNFITELLRKTAEHYLKDMVQLAFIRLPQFSETQSSNIKPFKMRPNSMEHMRNKRKTRHIPTKPSKQVEFIASQLIDKSNG